VLWPNELGSNAAAFRSERVKTLQRAFRTLSRSKLNTSQALLVLRRDFADFRMTYKYSSNLSKPQNAACEIG